jgi:hypothetical protein
VSGSVSERMSVTTLSLDVGCGGVRGLDIGDRPAGIQVLNGEAPLRPRRLFLPKTRRSPALLARVITMLTAFGVT